MRKDDIPTWELWGWDKENWLVVAQPVKEYYIKGINELKVRQEDALSECTISELLADEGTYKMFEDRAATIKFYEKRLGEMQ